MNPVRGAARSSRRQFLFLAFSAAFNAAWSDLPVAIIDDIDGDRLLMALRSSNRHEAVRNAVDLYVDKLRAENNRSERPPAFWFVVVPEFVYGLGRPKSQVPKEQRLPSRISISINRARIIQQQPTMFGEEDAAAAVYQYASDFRRQLKARLLEHQIVTQIVRETTLTPGEFKTSNGNPIRRLEDEATVAWKLCTGSYYKAGGRPWQLADVRDGVCYVGLAYKRTSLLSNNRHACCAAQMFLADGEGVVFRGALGPWFHADTKQFHLSQAFTRRTTNRAYARCST